MNVLLCVGLVLFMILANTPDWLDIMLAAGAVAAIWLPADPRDW